MLIARDGLPRSTASRASRRTWRMYAAWTKVDVVDICTQPYLHFEHILQANDANKHVICEKPLVELAARGGRVARRGSTLRRTASCRSTGAGSRPAPTASD